MKIGFCGSLLTNKIILFMTRTHCVNPHLTFLLFLSKFTVYLLRIYFPSRNLCSILFQILLDFARSASSSRFRSSDSLSSKKCRKRRVIVNVLVIKVLSVALSQGIPRLSRHQVHHEPRQRQRQQQPSSQS